MGRSRHVMNDVMNDNIYLQRYLVVGLGLPVTVTLMLVRLALWLGSGLALNEYRCEYGTLF